MRFEALKNRVERTESLVEGRMLQTTDSAKSLRKHWREGLTPPRILIAGLLAGFLSGHARPARTLRTIGKLAGPGSLRTISALTGLATSLQAAFAALTATQAADDAEEAADKADVHADSADNAAAAAAGVAAHPGEGSNPVPPSDRRRRADEAWSSAPSPAEAATELSER